MGKGLIDALGELDGYFDGRGLHIPKDYYFPGYLVVLAAFIHSRKITQQSVYFSAGSNSSYCSALGLSLALWGKDDYTNTRRNVGVNYSMLTHLSHRDSPDEASGQINSCLRDMAEGAIDMPGFIDLVHVVGELHDNVWAHGKASGFSVCQRRKCVDEDDHILEFALADCGMGFLRELQRVGNTDCSSHQDAIKWCILEGNTTKPSNERDEFAQKLPTDSIGGAPFGGVVETFDDDNHHQGLGLHHLLALVNKYKGELYLITGDAVLHIDWEGDIEYSTLPVEWSGVAVSCSIKESSLQNDNQDSDEYSAEIDALMEKMRAS